MKTIRDAQILIGMLEQGELNQELSAELSKCLKHMGELSEENPKVAYKGTLNLKLNIDVEAGEVHIKAEIDSKLPKRPRRSTLFWVTDDGDLSTEHPRQADMFATREVGERRS
jgi:hypothetical protein